MYTYGQPRWPSFVISKAYSKAWNDTPRTGNVLYAELLDRKLGLDSEFRGEEYVLLTVLCLGWNCKCGGIVVHTTDPQASFFFGRLRLLTHHTYQGSACSIASVGLPSPRWGKLRIIRSLKLGQLLTTYIQELSIGSERIRRTLLISRNVRSLKTQLVQTVYPWL